MSGGSFCYESCKFSSMLSLQGQVGLQVAGLAGQSQLVLPALRMEFSGRKDEIRISQGSGEPLLQEVA